MRVNSYVACDLFPRWNKVFTQNLVYWIAMNFFFFWFSSAILLSKMRSLFVNLSTSPKLNNLPIDYSEKYVLAYRLKRI